MFQSYQWSSDPVNVAEKDRHNYYAIVDDDFTGHITCGWRDGLSVAIIEVYERRGLNVGANLFRAFQYYVKVYGGKSWLMDDMIHYSKQQNPKYAKYADDVEKYRILI